MTGADGQSPFLYMPMEIAARELDSRLLIAFFATKLGLEVVMGQKWLLQKNAAAMPRGYWIFKTLTPGDATRMQRIGRRGHRIAAIDEEMPGLMDGAKRLRWVDPRAAAACETMFCLGPKHVEAMRNRFPEHGDKLVVTGNPRWDYLRPELRSIYTADAAGIRAEHGRFILINTNIGLVNSAKNSAEALIKSLTRDGRIDLDRADDRAFVDDLQAFESANFAAAPKVARRLTEAFPDHKVVLRPHPTEKIEPYERELAGAQRVEIIRDGPAAAWLAATDLLVHTSCTTANEAFALGAPAVCYQTIPSPLHTYFLSGAVSDIATSEDDVIKEASKIIAGERDAARDAEKRAVFEDYFAAQSGPFAAERIARFVADALGVEGPSPDAPKWKPGWLFRKRWRPTGFQRNIFPDFSASDLEARLDAIGAALGEPSRPSVTRCGDGQFHLVAAG